MFAHPMKCPIRIIIMDARLGIPRLMVLHVQHKQRSIHMTNSRSGTTKNTKRNSDSHAQKPWQ